LSKVPVASVECCLCRLLLYSLYVCLNVKVKVKVGLYVSQFSLSVQVTAVSTAHPRFFCTLPILKLQLQTLPQRLCVICQWLQPAFGSMPG